MLRGTSGGSSANTYISCIAFAVSCVALYAIAFRNGGSTGITTNNSDGVSSAVVTGTRMTDAKATSSVAAGPNPYPASESCTRAPLPDVPPTGLAPLPPLTPPTPTPMNPPAINTPPAPAPTPTTPAPTPAPAPAEPAKPLTGPIVPVPYPVQAPDPVALEVGSVSALNGLTYPYETLPYRARDAHWQMSTSYDPSFANSDLANNFWDTDPENREFIWLDLKGAGVTNYNFLLIGEPYFQWTYWPVIRIYVDGALVYEATYGDCLKGLHWPLQVPNSGSHATTAGLGVHVPIVYHSHFRISAYVPKSVDGETGTIMVPSGAREIVKNCVMHGTNCALLKSFWQMTYTRHREPVGTSFRTVWEQRQKAMKLPKVPLPPPPADPPKYPPPPVDELLYTILQSQTPEVQAAEYAGYIAFAKMVDKRKSFMQQAPEKTLNLREAKLMLDGEPFTILDLPSSSGAITAFYFNARALDWDGVELEFVFDGVTPAQVNWVPASAFFGTARFGRGVQKAVNPAVAILDRRVQITHWDGDSGDPKMDVVAQITFPMPYWKSVRIRARAVKFPTWAGIVNTKAEPEAPFTLISYATRYREVDPKANGGKPQPLYDQMQAGYFRTFFNKENPKTDANAARPVISVPRGWGHVSHFNFQMLMTTEYLEGDFHYYWDHSRAAFSIGIGTEDHFSYGHRFFHGTPSSYTGFGCTAREGIHPEVVNAYRYYGTESMAFNDGFRMYIELVNFNLDPNIMYSFHTAHHYYQQATATAKDAVAPDSMYTGTPAATTTQALLDELKTPPAADALVHRHALVETDSIVLSDKAARDAHNYRLIGSPDAARTAVDSLMTGVEAGAFEGLFEDGKYTLNAYHDSPAAHLPLKEGEVVSFRVKLLPNDPSLTAQPNNQYQCQGVILRRAYAMCCKLERQAAVVWIDGKLVQSERPALPPAGTAPAATGSVAPMSAADTDAFTAKAKTATGVHLAKLATESIAESRRSGAEPGQYQPADVWWAPSIGYVEKYRWAEHDLYIPLGHTAGKTEIEVTFKVLPGTWWDDRQIQVFCQV